MKSCYHRSIELPGPKCSLLWLIPAAPFIVVFFACEAVQKMVEAPMQWCLDRVSKWNNTP